MDIEALRKIQDESQRVAATYEFFDEDKRLNHSQAARVEFLTTAAYIEKYLPQGGTLLDVGAGAGEYSLHFARRGNPVTAVELSPRNLEAFRRKLTPELPIRLIQGDARDLSAFEDASFDAVLLLGPLYHLEKAEDRSRCIREAMRVCKPEGTIFLAFISNDMVILTEFCFDPDYFKGSTYDHATFRVENFPFMFFTLEEARQMVAQEGLTSIHEIASDGVSEMLAEKINALDAQSYALYLRYHLYCCEKPEMLGRSNHLLLVAKKEA